MRTQGESIYAGAYMRLGGAGCAYTIAHPYNTLSSPISPISPDADDRAGFSCDAFLNGVVFGCGNFNSSSGRVVLKPSASEVIIPTPAQSDPRHPGDKFGRQVRSVDSGQVLIGSPRADRFGVSVAGEAYLFDGINLRTIQRAASEVSPGTSIYHGNFGEALEAVGTEHIVVGAYSDGHNQPGRFYVFDRTNLASAPRILDSPGTPGFGYSLAVLNESEVIVGAFGAVYIVDVTTVPNPTSRVTIPLEKGATGKTQFFGAAVARLDSLVLVGAPKVNFNKTPQPPASERGVVFVYSI